MKRYSRIAQKGSRRHRVKSKASRNNRKTLKRSRHVKRKRSTDSCCSASNLSRRGKRAGNAFRYTGGKAAIADDIHRVICSTEEKLVGKIQPNREPFAGAMSVVFKFAMDVDEGC